MRKISIIFYLNKKERNHFSLIDKNNITRDGKTGPSARKLAEKLEIAKTQITAIINNKSELYE